MTQKLKRVKKSFEKIASKAKEIKDSLLPIEKRIRESCIKVPKMFIFEELYQELLKIQRIAATQSKKEDELLLIKIKSMTLSHFVGALYMPLKKIDFKNNYETFYKDNFKEHPSYFPYNDEKLNNTLDLLIKMQKLPKTEKEKEDFEINLRKSREDIVHKQKLKDLQYLYNLDIAPFIQEYIGLLKLIKNNFEDFSEFDFKKLEERTINTNLLNSPIKIFSPRSLSLENKKEEEKIIRQMIKSKDWSASFSAIKNFIIDCENPKLGNLRKYRTLSTDHYFTPVNISAPKRKEIIGIDENLTRLEALIRGYALGKSTPNIVLLGLGGVGKTTSLQYVIETTKDIKNIKYFLMNSLTDIKQLVELNIKYKPVGIIDDMRGEINPSVYSCLKQELEGLGNKFFDKALIIISANPAIWNSLDDPVKQRLGGVTLEYKPNPNSYEKLVKQFCNKFEVKYKPEIVKHVKEMVPRQVRDYIRTLGSEQAGLEEKIKEFSVIKKV